MKFASFGSTIALTLSLAAVACNVHAKQDVAQAGCTLTGTYSSSSDLSGCSHITISSLNVPAGVQLDLTKVPSGATITFTGTTTFGTELWQGPLVLLTGSNLKVNGTDPQFALPHLQHYQLGRHDAHKSHSRLELGRRARQEHGRFRSQPEHGLKILSNTIKNQDDCLAMQSSTDTTFSDNTCIGGHGISVGSIGGDAVDSTDTVSGLIVSGNQITNSENGLRIKTIVGLEGLVFNATYTENTLTNVKNAIVMHSDYDKATQGYSGTASSKVDIKDITISGLKGTATNLYDVFVNPSVVSGWKWSGVTVMATNKGSCKGEPSTVTCA